MSFIKYVNNIILKDASKLVYLIKDVAPNNEGALFNSTSLVVWSGESTNTIFQDEKVNWAIRALHDQLHLKTGLGFNPVEEIELGTRQASLYANNCQSRLADLVYCEVAGQAEYFLKTGKFVSDQVEFTKVFLKLDDK